MPLFVRLSMLFLFALSLLILFSEGFLSGTRRVFFVFLALCLAFAARLIFMGHETLDYQNFLLPWVQFFRKSGGLKALADFFGNYNAPYTYLLAVFSYIDASPLYLIKLSSIFFDIILAWAVLKIVLHLTEDENCALVSFLSAMLLPTVMLNSACWAQCDGIYAAFSLWALYFGLKEKFLPSMICMAIGFSFKLQAIFMLPVFGIFLFSGKMKFRYVFVFPLAYIAMMLPVIFAGRGIKDALLYYFTSMGTTGSGINYNSVSIFALLKVPFMDYNPIIPAAFITLAFLLTLAIVFAGASARKKLSSKTQVLAAALLVTVIPFLLPHMHDRYFYLSEVMLLVLGFSFRNLFYFPFFSQFASLLSYYAYLMQRYLLPLSLGSAVLLLLLIILIYYFIRQIILDHRSNIAVETKEAEIAEN